MTVLSFSLLLAAVSVVAGFLGSLTGLGGGVIVVPALALLFGVDIRYAIGASVVSVIATSSGAAATYVREGIPNIRIGLFLEIATTLGALAGAYLAVRISTDVVGIIFGGVLIYSALQSVFSHHDAAGSAGPDALAQRLRLDGDYIINGDRREYHVQHVPTGFGVMFIAGSLSGLLGIGSGAFKVLAMDRAMKIPFKVSTTTSNFMIGVTGAASAGVYLSRGYIEPAIAMPVMIGVLAGAFVGSRVLLKTDPSLLRRVFAAMILLVAIEMIYNGLTGKL